MKSLYLLRICCWSPEELKAATGSGQQTVVWHEHGAPMHRLRYSSLTSSLRALNNLVQASQIHLSWWSQKMTASLDVLKVLFRCGKSEESKCPTVVRADRIQFSYSWLEMASRGLESATATCFVSWALGDQWTCYIAMAACTWGSLWLDFEVHHTFWDIYIYIYITHEAAYNHHWACRMSCWEKFRAYIFLHYWQGKCLNLV